MLDARTQVRRLAEEIGFFGFSRDSQRWGEVFVAPRAKWRVLVDSWESRVGVWMLGLGRWRPVVEVGRLGDFWSEDWVGVCCVRFRLWWVAGLMLGWSEKVVFQ